MKQNLVFGLKEIKKKNEHHKFKDFFKLKYSHREIENPSSPSLTRSRKNNKEEADAINSDIKIFIHHIYEYEKGLRNLVLHTGTAKHRSYIENKLKKCSISYVIQKVSSKKINVFFGNSACIKVINEFGNKKLCDFNDEEDFILGIMLGYDRLKQCERYVKRKNKKKFRNR